VYRYHSSITKPGKKGRFADGTQYSEYQHHTTIPHCDQNEGRMLMVTTCVQPCTASETFLTWHPKKIKDESGKKSYLFFQKV
jgi:hypothetical protein